MAEWGHINEMGGLCGSIQSILLANENESPIKAIQNLVCSSTVLSHLICISWKARLHFSEE